MSDLGFSFATTGGADVRIARGGRVVTTLRGAAARQFLADVDGADETGVQQACARVTGNYRRGNEAVAREHPRNRRP